MEAIERTVVHTRNLDMITVDEYSITFWKEEQVTYTCMGYGGLLRKEIVVDVVEMVNESTIADRTLLNSLKHIQHGLIGFLKGLKGRGSK